MGSSLDLLRETLRKAKSRLAHLSERKGAEQALVGCRTVPHMERRDPQVLKGRCAPEMSSDFLPVDDDAQVARPPIQRITARRENDLTDCLIELLLRLT